MKNKLYLVGLFLYVICYKLLINNSNYFFIYIINPTIWLILSTYIFFHNKDIYYKYQKQIIYLLFIIATIYNLIYYGLGFIFGYANNAYDTSLEGIIINLFSLVIVAFCKEYIRAFLINSIFRNKFFYYFLITIFFIISDLNIQTIYSDITDKSDIFIVFLENVTPSLTYNFLALFLIIHGGIWSSFIYKCSFIIPSLIINITPKYELMETTIFNVLTPVFTYLYINYNIEKKKKDSKRYIESPKKWILIFSLSLVLLLFFLGVYPVKPVVILSASMKPSIKEGDLVIVTPCDITNIKEGTIILYKLNNYQVLHRVVDVINSEEGIKLVTKGDNNNKKDSGSISESNIIGCYQFRIPYLGYPSYLWHKFFQNQEVDVEIGD
ncbi:MAG: signal peptidase I [Bacilli bacterium]|nr:signal peptidase I [Bacilli bacterium]